MHTNLIIFTYSQWRQVPWVLPWPQHTHPHQPWVLGRWTSPGSLEELQQKPRQEQGCKDLSLLFDSFTVSNAVVALYVYLYPFSVCTSDRCTQPALLHDTRIIAAFCENDEPNSIYRIWYCRQQNIREDKSKQMNVSYFWLKYISINHHRYTMPMFNKRMPYFLIQLQSLFAVFAFMV